MAKCRWCSRGGFFTTVDANGLCRECAPSVTLSIKSQVRVIVDSQKLVETSKNWKTKMDRAQLIVDSAGELVPFAQRDIPTVSPSPSELIDHYQTERGRILCDALEQSCEQARERSAVASTPSGKLNPLAKAVLDIQAAKATYPEVATSTSRLDELEATAAETHHAARLDVFVEAAKKAEFKGQWKKALDQYQEALFLLRNDNIDDSQQARQIDDLEAKIAEIEKTLKQ